MPPKRACAVDPQIAIKEACSLWVGACVYMCARTAARAALLVAWHEGTVRIYNYLVIPICEYRDQGLILGLIVVR